MKPLVNWCRWHEARLRLRGRDTGAVWGELVFADRTTPFLFHLAERRLVLDPGPAARYLLLDEMGVERPR